MIFPSYPGNALKKGSKGRNVKLMQDAMNVIFDYYPLSPQLEAVGIFDEATENAVKSLQNAINLKTDGEIGTKTWYSILAIANLLDIA